METGRKPQIRNETMEKPEDNNKARDGSPLTATAGSVDVVRAESYANLAANWERAGFGSVAEAICERICRLCEGKGWRYVRTPKSGVEKWKCCDCHGSGIISQNVSEEVRTNDEQ